MNRKSLSGAAGIFWGTFGASFAVILLVLSDGRKALTLPTILLSALIGGLLIACLAYAALFAAILFHELGHLFAGLVAGMQLRFISVLGLGVSNSEGRLHPFRVKRAQAGGFVAMLPREGSDYVKGYRTLILGGPLVSILYVLITYFLWRQLPAPKGAPLGHALLNVSAFMAFVMALTVLPGTLYPKTIKGVVTDAKLLILLAKPSRTRDSAIGSLSLSHLIASGVRAREWPTNIMEVLQRPGQDPIFEVRGCLGAYYHYCDSGDLEHARELLARAKGIADELKKDAGVPGEGIAYEMVYLDALQGIPADPLSGEPHELAAGAFFRANAAVSLRQRNLAAASEYIDKATAALDTVQKNYGFKTATERAWLDDLRSQVA